MISTQALQTRADEITALGLFSPAELRDAAAIAQPNFPFPEAFALADSVHFNVKVDQVSDRFRDWAAQRQGREENRKPGYLKYAFPDGVHLILSAIDISEEDRMPVAYGRARPFLDHIGIDLRQETSPVRALFDAIPFFALKAGWPYVSQGQPGNPVSCCHVQVAAKHWVFPKETASVPLEFAWGPLVLSNQGSGCDLRPANPNLYRTDVAAPRCCGS